MPGTLAKIEITIDKIPINKAKIKPMKTTLAIVLLLALSTSTGLNDTFAWFKSKRVATKIWVIENTTPNKIHKIPSKTPTEVAQIKIIELTITANELTIEQNKTFANNKYLALIGNNFVFKAAKPSRVMLVAQNFMHRYLAF